MALPSQAATSLALAVNELVQNALEHAFVGQQQGHVLILLEASPGALVVTIQDDGVGLTGSWPRHLGLEIVETLVREDLRGTWTLTGNGGTTACLRIPL